MGRKIVMESFSLDSGEEPLTQCRINYMSSEPYHKKRA
jgi:hypothetical protein